jgi:hypothetical protein
VTPAVMTLKLLDEEQPRVYTDVAAFNEFVARMDKSRIESIRVELSGPISSTSEVSGTLMTSQEPKEGLTPEERSGVSEIMNTRYDTDFDAWLAQQIDALRARDWNQVDAEHLAEEIAEVRKSERRAVRSHLRNLLSHLLKWAYQPEERERNGASWQTTVRNARVLIGEALEESNTLAHELPELLAHAYRLARQDAAEDTGLPLATFPLTCRWTVQGLLARGFWPERVDWEGR